MWRTFTATNLLDKLFNLIEQLSIVIKTLIFVQDIILSERLLRLSDLLKTHTFYIKIEILNVVSL